jgi:hypothetical protein
MAVDVALDAAGLSSSYNSGYTVNVTSAIEVSGSYVQLNETHRQVTLSCGVSNEGKPASIGDLEANYEQDAPASWVAVDVPSVVYFGNGTCAVFFAAENAP